MAPAATLPRLAGEGVGEEAREEAALPRFAHEAAEHELRSGNVTERNLPRICRAGEVILVAALLAACGPPQTPPPVENPQAETSRHVRNRFFHREDANVMRVEPGPHEGTGTTTAYRYFDDVADAKLIFRKRALHPGASIGMHVLTHDEVYYVVSGRGELTVDDTTIEVGPDSATFMHEGADVGIRQLGEEDLVIIVAYPPAAEK